MKDIRVRITTPGGELLDSFRTNAPDFADERTARALEYHPGAVVKRTETETRPGEGWSD